MTKNLGNYERAYPMIWNQYLFLTSARERQEHRFEALILIASILIFIFFSLGLHTVSVYNYAALGSYILVFLIALYDIMPRKIMVPWVEKKDFDKKIKDPNKIAKQLVEEVYGHISEIGKIVDYRQKHLKWIIILILSGSLVPFITSFVINYGPLYSLFIGLSGAAVILFFYKKFGTKLTENQKRFQLVSTKSIKKTLRDIPHLILGFKYVWIAIILFCLVNVLLHILLWPSSLDYLTLSADRPWAFLPSAFVHWDSSHLFNNLWAFVGFGLVFVFVNMFGSMERKKYWSKFFFYLVFIGGILAGVIEFLARHFMGRHDTIAGSSGLVYASIGVLFASSLFISLSYLLDGFIKRGFFKNTRKLLDFALNIATFIFLFLYLTHDPSDFLSVGPKTGVFAHGYGFLLGFSISVILFFIARKLKTQTNA